jgi:hypothetical protein
MIDYSTKVNISISQKHGLDDYPDHDFTLSFDAADFTVIQWFNVFEKILTYVGFSERTIVNGATGLAFNETRNHKDMKSAFDSFELSDFATTFDENVHEAPF